MVFLDAVERRYVDELGGMNVFFVFDDGTMVTPPLTGTILPGITRDVDHHARRRARASRPSERPYSIDEWRADAASGRLTEAFACGTAAVITPIGARRVAAERLHDRRRASDRPGHRPRLRTELVDIQRGRAADRHGWVHRVL